MTRLTQNLFPLLLSAVMIFAVMVPAASASGPYTIGSGNTVTADPLVTRPTTTPCVVQLFTGAQFTDFNVENFTYTPPTACPGPWAKVVLESDINLNAGIQYDRTANYWLGPVNIYFGTTSEPSPSLGPSWHIESDLTEYSSIFTTTQSGQADIGNTLCCGLTSTIFASASLEFYPLEQGQSAPVTAAGVYAISAGPSGGTITLNTGTDTASGTFTLPTNVKNAYLDVYSQGQSGDEFWYTCVPNDVSGELESCSNTGYRETEVTIDGQAAGVAPVFPWIFTGGIDPFLWFPIPGVQTLNFTPYRVDLTPFAGLLSNGQPHTVSLSVFNANGYFEATANLFVYTDPGSAQVTGAVTTNTLAAPNPTITENLNSQPTYLQGTVDVASRRTFVIAGYANTSGQNHNQNFADGELQQSPVFRPDCDQIRAGYYPDFQRELDHHGLAKRRGQHRHHAGLHLPAGGRHQGSHAGQRRHQPDHQCQPDLPAHHQHQAIRRDHIQQFAD